MGRLTVACLSCGGIDFIGWIPPEDRVMVCDVREKEEERTLRYGTWMRNKEVLLGDSFLLQYIR